ncbi:hypothetical protein AAG565_04450 [Fontimonas sp. SYSU GA230001]|uniref:hypothetical protein n=1 Tax=Fontimonas sp. SYSU GA230001 TaxID=3142450 RepID=UPI0032B59222
MKTAWFTSMALALIIGLGPAAAQDGSGEPLSAAELARCAQQVQQLRAESARILADSARLDAQRGRIDERRRRIEADAATPDRGDLAQRLALSDRRQQLSAEATAFNARIEQLRGEIASINAVKLDYERGCAQRPYRRRDLERLPQAAQEAMRAGLDDVRVPYIEAVTPVAAEVSQAETAQ